MNVETTIFEELKASVASTGGAAAKYQRLEETLTNQIAANRLLPGTQLPADKEFAARIGISLGTVQKALVNLHRRGLVTRAPKRGTAIAVREVGENDIYVFRFRDQETGRLIPPKVRTVSVTETGQSGPWSGLVGTTTAVCIERILQIGIEPAVYSQVFVRYEDGKALLSRTKDELSGFSVHRHVEKHLGTPVVRSESRVNMGYFDDRAARQLGLDEETPSLIWEVSSFSHENRPVSFQRLQIPPDHRPLEFRRIYGQ